MADLTPLDPLIARDRASLLSAYRRLKAGDNSCVFHLNRMTSRRYSLDDWLAMLEPVAKPLDRHAGRDN
jgi:hypothetical protein